MFVQSLVLALVSSGFTPLDTSCEPILIGVPARNPNESLVDYVERHKFETEKFGSVIAITKATHSLLIPAQEQSYVTNNWECLEVLEDLLGNTSLVYPEISKNGELVSSFNGLSDRSKTIAFRKFASVGGFRAIEDVPRDAVVRAKFDTTITVIDSGGNRHVILRSGEGKRFDAEKYRNLFEIKFERAIPRELLGAFEGVKPIAPGEYSVLELRNKLAKSVKNVFIDKRAEPLRSVFRSQSNLNYGNAFSAIMFTNDLFWRRVGDSWVIAASPLEPRSLSYSRLRQKARLKMFNNVALLAKMGLLTESLVPLIARSDTPKIGDMPNEVQQLLLQTIQNGTCLSNKNSLQKLLSNGGALSQSKFEVSINLSLSIRWSGNSITIGIAKP
jgi:hypothetical protein